MSGPDASFATPVASGLHTRRCARHPTREAAARCPSCQEFFCRECVVEHEGRLLCAACLARTVSARARHRQRWVVARRAGIGVAGFILLWLCFQSVGALLLRIPPKVHDGTVWQPLIERGGP